MKHRLFFLLLCAALSALVPRVSAAAETLVLAGQVTNTTRELSAPGRFELTFDGEKIGGFFSTEAPLSAGRWPVEGTRRGAWCEIVCRQTPTTRVVFRGVLSPTDLRGTYIYGGGGELVQYGRFQVTAAPGTPAMPPPSATPAAK